MYFLAILHSYKNKISASIVMFSLLVFPFCQAAEKIETGQPLKILLNTQKQYDPQNLLFELDNMDVTRLVRFEEEIAWIHPAALLNQGSHYVKVYRFFKNELELLQQYDFDVIATDSNSSSDSNILHVDQRSSTLNIDNSINASMTALTSDKYLATKQRWTLDGSSTISGEWAGNGWALDAETNLFFDKNNPANDTPFMTLDDYLINVKRGQLSTQIGHHRTEESNLVLQNFHRRGLSMHWASENKDKRFTGFVFNSKRIEGFRYGLGISNKKSRVIGGVLTLKPFASYQQTEFAATWLTGKNQQEYMMLDEQGHALALSLKSQHFNERLTLQGDIARSVFDDGMNGMGMEASKPKEDKAYRSSIEYHAIQADDDNNHSLSFNFENRYVGTSFYSLANLGLSSDVRSTRLSMNYTKNALSLQSSIEQQRNNVSHDPMQATVDSLQLETSIDFSPENTKAMRNSFWGKPHFSLRLSSAQENSISLPIDAISMDKQLHAAVLSADFSHNTWDWSARFSYDRLEEETGHVETTHNQTLDIAINRQLSETSQLSAQWQMYKRRALGMDDTVERLMIISGSTELIPKKLTANGSLTLMREEQTWDPVANLRASTLEFGLNYIPKVEKNKKFKYNLWLKGQYHKQHDIWNPMSNRETYQVSTGFNMTF